jgi:GNAT superfamily N-acetyltransferase
MILIREAIESDHAFILATWLRSAYAATSKTVNDNKVIKLIKPDIFFREHQELIKQILSDNKTFTYVACAEDYQDQLFGYICVHGDCLHYLYVKQPYRKNGVATKLIEEIGSDSIINHSHWSGDFVHLSRKIKSSYNPYIFFRGIDEN